MRVVGCGPRRRQRVDRLERAAAGRDHRAQIEGVAGAEFRAVFECGAIDGADRELHGFGRWPKPCQGGPSRVDGGEKLFCEHFLETKVNS